MSIVSPTCAFLHYQVPVATSSRYDRDVNNKTDTQQQLVSVSIGCTLCTKSLEVLHMLI